MSGAGSVSLPGGVAPANFTGPAAAAFVQAGFGPNSIVFDGTGTFPTPSPGQTLIINALPGTTITLPDGPPNFGAIFDANGGDTINGGTGNSTIFLQSGLPTGTVVNTNAGNDLIYAGGADTINAGSGSDTIIAGAGNNNVNGGTGSVVVDARGDDLRFVGGSGAVSVVGGSGNDVLFGSTGSASTYLQGGTGNSTLVGGSGTGPSTIGGGNNITAFAAGTGPTTLIAGTGTSVLDGLTGKGVESFSTSPFATANTTALMALNGAADTVVGGSGHSTVIGGAGPDTYAFLSGNAGGSETILGLKFGDRLIFGLYQGNPIASEGVTNGSDVIKLTDGTSITLAGFDHKLFS
jgi:Ca2+-binding RTX toxin-like protein